MHEGAQGRHLEQLKKSRQLDVSFDFSLFFTSLSSSVQWFCPASSVSLASVYCDLSSTYQSRLTSTQQPGANREVKKAVEAYWAGKLSVEKLTEVAADVKKASLTCLKARNVDLIPRFVFNGCYILLLTFISGDFSLYDHVLDHSAAFNVIPKRYTGLGLSDLDVYFAMGRGRQADGVDVPACEMKKWCIYTISFITIP